MKSAGKSVLVRFGSFKNEGSSSVRSVRVRFYSHLYVQYDGNRIRYSRIWHDPVIFLVIGPSVLSAANQNA